MTLLFAKNNSLSAVTALPASVSGGGLNLISTQTASSSSTIDFTSGIDSTYKEYIFKFYNIHPSTQSSFVFNMSVDSGSNYNVAKTTTYFHASNNEAGGSNEVAYQSGSDLAQGTGFQRLQNFAASNNDDCCVGTLHLFDLSNTTFVKHFLSTFNSVSYTSTPYSIEAFVAGYGNTTNAVDAIQFKFESGTFDGTIKLYGVT
jgi:hypothetical protein